jgi:adenylosuccinate synthase
MSDLRDLDNLREKLAVVVEFKNKLFTAVYGAEPIGLDGLFEKCKYYASRLANLLTDTTEFLHRSIKEGKSVLFEGAQGSLLDLDHGTFPFVTSSNCSLLGMPAGSGVPGKLVDVSVGVCKAYMTRVGAGPFPTELDNEVGQYIRQKGQEYGTTTGRPRRCGWFDAVAVRYAVTINAIDQIAMMHLDTLTGQDQIEVCKAYRIGPDLIEFFPSNIDRLRLVQPIYHSLPGWREDISSACRFEQLPTNAQRYIEYIEGLLGRPIRMIGVGPSRDQLILR